MHIASYLQNSNNMCSYTIASSCNEKSNYAYKPVVKLDNVSMSGLDLRMYILSGFLMNPFSGDFCNDNLTLYNFMPIM